MIRASDAKISRLELGRVGFKQRDVADLLTLYRITEETDREKFLAQARRANSPGWWRQYGDVLPSWFERYFGLEQAAAVIRTHDPEVVPGLLQTESYAHALIQLRHPHAGTNEIERRVALHMNRQQLLTQPGTPNLWTMIDEAALRRPLGTRELLKEQLRQLIELATLPNITLQVLPFHVGGHAATGSGAFTILRFGESELPDIVYLEQLDSALYLDKKRDTDNYLRTMDRLCIQAESPTETTSFLHRILKEG